MRSLRTLGDTHKHSEEVVLDGQRWVLDKGDSVNRTIWNVHTKTFKLKRSNSKKARWPGKCTSVRLITPDRGQSGLLSGMGLR